MTLPPALSAIVPGWHRLPRRRKLAMGILIAEILIAVAGTPLAIMALDDGEAAVARTRADVARTRAQATTARRESEYVLENVDLYQKILASGLLTPQNRLTAKASLERVALENALGTLLFEFAPQTISPAGRDLEMITTPLTLRAGAILDRDIVKALNDVTTALPGAVVVRGVNITRTGEITEAVLDDIRSGTSVDLVTAELKLEWRTARQAERAEKAR